MGHRNTPFTGHMIDIQTEQHGRSQPEPCIFYGSVANFPQPNIHHSVFPAAGNRCNFNFHHVPPECRDSALFYGMPHQHPALNLDLAIAAPSGPYNPYLAPPFAIRDIPTQPNHGIVGIVTDSYGRNISYVDSIGGSFKRKNAVGPSSSVSPSESDVTSLMDVASFVPPEYGGSNDPTSMVESGSRVVSTRNRPGIVAPESVVARNTSHLIQGGFVAPPVGSHGNPWPDMHFGANNGDVGTFGWTHAPMPYVHALDISASVNGASNRSSSGFLPPPFAQGHPNPHHPPPPMQGVRGYNLNLPSQVAASSRRITSSNTGMNVVDVRPTFLAPVPPTGFRLYRPQQREILLDSSARPHTFPHLRVLPEDEVAILEIPGYHEAGESIDQHRDMRLDIDHMSYEELLALEEQIGCVGTGLPEDFIRNYLKIRTFATSAACLNLEGETCPNQQINFCVICQTDYENEEDIGTVDCGHEYHRECIKKWLLLKNTCPVCKSTALSRKAKDL